MPRAGRRGSVRRIATLAMVACAVPVLLAAGTPSQPTQSLDDRAGLLSASVAAKLQDDLTSFRARTGHEVVVSIFPSLPSASLEEFTVRTAAAWRIGRKGLDDGVIFFAFVAERKLRLEVGYGLEDEIPDAISSRILNRLVVPELAAGNADRAIALGVEGIFAAIEGKALPDRDASAPGDVPLPPSDGLRDGANLFDAAGRARVEAALQRFVAETGCRLAIDVVDGAPAAHSEYSSEDVYATRSFFRAHPRSPGMSDDDYFAWLGRLPPSAGLFVFVYGRSPLSFGTRFYGSSACLPEAMANTVLDVEVESATVRPPDLALAYGLEVLALARRGEWAPPAPPPPPPPSAADQAFARVAVFASAVSRLHYGPIPVGWILFFAVLSIVLALPVRARPIARRLKSGQSFWRAWGIESGKVFLWFVVQAASTTFSSSGSSRSSSSSGTGGGGSFGGGGASASW